MVNNNVKEIINSLSKEHLILILNYFNSKDMMLRGRQIQLFKDDVVSIASNGSALTGFYKEDGVNYQFVAKDNDNILKVCYVGRKTERSSIKLSGHKFYSLQEDISYYINNNISNINLIVNKHNIIKSACCNYGELLKVCVESGFFKFEHIVSIFTRKEYADMVKDIVVKKTELKPEGVTPIVEDSSVQRNNFGEIITPLEKGMKKTTIVASSVKSGIMKVAHTIRRKWIETDEVFRKYEYRVQMTVVMKHVHNMVKLGLLIIIKEEPSAEKEAAVTLDIPKDVSNDQKDTVTKEKENVKPKNEEGNKQQELQKVNKDAIMLKAREFDDAYYVTFKPGLFILEDYKGNVIKEFNNIYNLEKDGKLVREMPTSITELFFARVYDKFKASVCNNEIHDVYIIGNKNHFKKEQEQYVIHYIYK